MKQTIILLCLSLLFVQMTPGSNVKANNKLLTKESVSEADSFDRMIEKFDNQLIMSNSTVLKEIQDFIQELSALRKDGSFSTVDHSDNVPALIQDLNHLIDQYESYFLIKEGHSKDDPDPNLIYAAAALIIIALFHNQGYLLAAELLTHATACITENSIYYPTYGYRVEYSNVFWKCRNNYSVSEGGDRFESTATTIETDLYYSIHVFLWKRLSNSNIRIYDRYDFSYDKSYWGSIQGIAVSFMWAAQVNGVLTPYWVYIEHA